MSEQDSKTKDLDQYLSGQDGLSNAYRKAAGEEPSSQLDQTILDASKHAVQKSPKIAYSPFSSNWAIPVSIAAILVLSISIVPILDEGDDSRDLEVLKDKVEATSMERRNDLGASKSGLPKKETLQTGVAPEAKMAAPSQASPTAEPAPKPVPEKIFTKKRKSQISTMEVTRPTSKTMEGAVLSSEMEETNRMRESDSLTDMSTDQREDGADIMEPRRQERQIQMAPQQSDSTFYRGKADESILSPEEWLTQIKALREDGKTEQAKKSLEEFRKYYPDYPIESILGIE